MQHIHFCFQSLYSTFQMRATILLLLLLATLVSCGYNFREDITVEEMLDAKSYCINKFLRCFRLNRCQEKKYKYRTKVCNKIYVECMNFAKSMLDKIKANDFMRHQI